eukprot:3640143-Amphidinium_carterae.2
MSPTARASGVPCRALTTPSTRRVFSVSSRSLCKLRAFWNASSWILAGCHLNGYALLASGDSSLVASTYMKQLNIVLVFLQKAHSMLRPPARPPSTHEWRVSISPFGCTSACGKSSGGSSSGSSSPSGSGCGAAAPRQAEEASSSAGGGGGGGNLFSQQQVRMPFDSPLEPEAHSEDPGI